MQTYDTFLYDSYFFFVNLINILPPMIQPLIKYPYHASLAGGGVNNLSDMMYH